MLQLRVIGFSILFFTVIFTVVSSVMYFGDWGMVALISCAGLFVGVVAAPSFEPKAFKHAWAYELFSGAAAGGAFGLAFGGVAEAAGLGALLGAFLGYLAPFWVKHVQVP